jgi:hypothetical protein
MSDRASGTAGVGVSTPAVTVSPKKKREQGQACKSEQRDQKSWLKQKIGIRNTMLTHQIHQPVAEANIDQYARDDADQRAEHMYPQWKVGERRGSIDKRERDQRYKAQRDQKAEAFARNPAPMRRARGPACSVRPLNPARAARNRPVAPSVVPISAWTVPNHRPNSKPPTIVQNHAGTNIISITTLTAINRTGARIPHQSDASRSQPASATSAVKLICRHPPSAKKAIAVNIVNTNGNRRATDRLPGLDIATHQLFRLAEYAT